MISTYIFLIILFLLVVGLPVGILWQFWLDEKEMKKKGLIK